MNVAQNVFFGGGHKERTVILNLPFPMRPFPTHFDIKRCIARWKGLVYASKVKQLMAVDSAYSVERQLHEIKQAQLPAKEREEFNPQKRPRVFDRLLRTGEPDIELALDRSTANGQFCALVPDPQGELGSLLDEPFWRLLDPTPLRPLQMDAIERHLGGRRVRKPVPKLCNEDWSARSKALGQCKHYRQYDAPQDLEFVCLCDLLLEIHRAKDARNVARYIFAVDAALDLTLDIRSEILQLIQGWRTVPQFEEFDIHQYISWAFGIAHLPECSDGDWKIARELLYREGIVFRRNCVHDDVYYYNAIMFHGVESPNKAATVFGWDTLRRGDGVEDEDEDDWAEDYVTRGPHHGLP